MGWGEGGALAQWVTPEGELLFPEALDMSARLSPEEVAVGYTGGVATAVALDQGDRRKLHVVRLDNQGGTVGDPSRIDFGVISYDELSLRDNFHMRPWGSDGSAVVCSYGWHHGEYQWGNVVEVTLLDPLGHEGPRTAKELGPDHHAKRVDAAPLPGETECRNFVYGCSVEIDSSIVGYGFNSLVVPPGRSAAYPSVAAVPDGSLLVWTEGQDDSWRLHSALVSGEPSSISGEPLGFAPGSQESPYLAPGPGQILCVFTMEVPGSGMGDDVYAMRLALDGTPIDELPILVASHGGPLYSPRAVWDGYRYIITWAWSGCVWAARMSERGELLDEEAALIGSGYLWRPGRVASDGDGTVVVAYNRSHVRFIFDHPSAGVEDAVSSRLTWRVAPNPMRGMLHLIAPDLMSNEASVAIFDPTGRRVGCNAARDGALIWDGRLPDGRPAPSGTYYIRLKQDGRQETRPFVLID